MCSNLEGAMHRLRRLDQHVQGQVGGAVAQQRPFGRLDVGHRLHLGNHDVHEAMTGLAGNLAQIGLERRVIDRVHAHRHAGRGCGGQRQFGHQRRVLGFAAHRGAVFAVQRHIEHAGAELLGHLGLQLQAFAHARLDAAVVVAHRQHHGAGLRALQHVGGM